MFQGFLTCRPAPPTPRMRWLLHGWSPSSPTVRSPDRPLCTAAPLSQNRWRNTFRNAGFRRRSWLIVLWSGIRSSRSIPSCQRNALLSAHRSSICQSDGMPYRKPISRYFTLIMVDGRTAILPAVQMCRFLIGECQIQHCFQLPQEMILWHQISCRYHVIFQLHSLASIISFFGSLWRISASRHTARRIFGGAGTISLHPPMFMLSPLFKRYLFFQKFVVLLRLRYFFFLVLSQKIFYCNKKRIQ